MLREGRELLSDGIIFFRPFDQKEHSKFTKVKEASEAGAERATGKVRLEKEGKDHVSPCQSG